MNEIGHIKTIYFIGIGGIGMSALARYAMMQGMEVFGYDKTPTDLTRELIAEGISVTYRDSLSELPSEKLNKAETLSLIHI